MVDFFVGVVLAEGKPQRAVSHVVHPADGQQYVAGVKAAGGAGGAGRGAHALGVQQKQQALALNALKAEADVAGQTVRQIAVHRAVGDFGQPCNKPVPHGGYPGHILVDMIAGLLQGRGHTADAGQVLRTGTLAPLLSASLNDVHQGEALADVQRANALGAVELVGGQAEHIDILLLDVNVQVSRRLNRVGVEGNPRFLADGADFRDGKNGADLIVGVHGGDQAGVGADGVLHLLGGDVVSLPDVQIGDLKALLFQLRQGVEHGVVLKGGGNDVFFALLFSPAGGGDDGLVVGLAAAGGEDDLPRLAAQALGHGFPGGVQRLPGPLAHGVQAGGVAVNFVKIGQHGVDRRLAHGRGCRVVSVNLHCSFLQRYLPIKTMGNIPSPTYFVNRQYKIRMPKASPRGECRGKRIATPA